MSTVKICKQTIEVLRNFVSVYTSLKVVKGSTLKTISLGEDCIAWYNCPEEFPVDFKIYDLPQFLQGIALFDDPVLDFESEDYVVIRSGNKRIKYHFAGENIQVKEAPAELITLPSTDVTFDLDEKDLSYIQKTRTTYKIDDLLIRASSSGKVRIDIADLENETSTVASIDLQGQSTGDYEFPVKVGNLHMLPGDYTVSITTAGGGAACWQHKDLDLQYLIAFEE